MDNPVLRFLRFLVMDNWPITLVAALGFVAIYLLLPRPRGGARAVGVAAAGLALLLTGALIVRAGAFTAEVVLFYAFSGIAVIAGGLLVTQSNPARAALSFALVVLSTCGLFLLQAAPFLMAATTIIYAGAIVVTFLFVIMLAQQEGVSDADQRSREPLLASLTGFVLLGAILYVLHAGYGTGDIDDAIARVRQAKTKPSAKEMAAVFGDEGHNFKAFFDGFRQAIKKGGDSSEARALSDAVDDLQDRWVGKVVRNDDAAEGRDVCERLEEVGLRARASYGILQPPADTRLSAYSGPPANAPLFPPADGKPDPGALRRDRDSRVPQMPHENTAYLGRALFTDYLLAVELGGTLLLVATVGAIAIAGRRGGRNA
ncbi:MAG TPA: NADH-quinone oxidoreductase subunit J [Gemmataceae bacterium]|nr:NADH-quinone oxidoreductase subunit J [Gemmataceae bacterium]